MIVLEIAFHAGKIDWAMFALDICSVLVLFVLNFSSSSHTLRELVHALEARLPSWFLGRGVFPLGRGTFPCAASFGFRQEKPQSLSA